MLFIRLLEVLLALALPPAQAAEQFQAAHAQGRQSMYGEQETGRTAGLQSAAEGEVNEAFL